MARKRVTLDEHIKLTAPTGLSALAAPEEEEEELEFKIVSANQTRPTRAPPFLNPLH